MLVEYDHIAIKLISEGSDIPCGCLCRLLPRVLRGVVRKNKENCCLAGICIRWPDNWTAHRCFRKAISSLLSPDAHTAYIFFPLSTFR